MLATLFFSYSVCYWHSLDLREKMFDRFKCPILKQKTSWSFFNSNLQGFFHNLVDQWFPFLIFVSFKWCRKDKDPFNSRRQTLQSGSIMYEETACFDPNSMPERAEDGFFQTVPNCSSLPAPPLMASSITNSHTRFENLRLPMEELSYHRKPPQEDASASATTPIAAAAMEIELQQQLGFNMENCYNNSNNNTHFMQEVIHDSNQVLSFDQSIWLSPFYFFYIICFIYDVFWQYECTAFYLS